MVFIDGLGIGPRDPDRNPLARFNPQVLSVFEEAIGPVRGNGIVLQTDAQMGIGSMPQSATNQTTLFTGTNAAAILGGHLSGFPNKALKEMLGKHSLMQRLQARGIDTAFANAYHPRFFTHRPRWISVTTVMCETAGVRLRTLEDLHDERALYMDYTNQLLRERGCAVPLHSPRKAAKILSKLARNYSFCLYEYFLTDLVGHRGTLEEATRMLDNLDEFLSVLVEQTLPQRSLLVTSDHGNIEVMSHKGHTGNKVPTIIWGDMQALVAGKSSISLAQISSLVENFLSEDWM